MTTARRKRISGMRRGRAALASQITEILSVDASAALQDQPWRPRPERSFQDGAVAPE